MNDLYDCSLKSDSVENVDMGLSEPQNIAASVKLLQRAHRLKVDAVAAEQAAEAEQAAAAEELLKRRLVKQGKQVKQKKA